MTTISLPYRLEPFGQSGWTVARMSAQEAAAFVRANPQAEMPCWKRFDEIDGQLFLVR
jgi:hypothetical protein